jgi:Protein of unknown function (DUF1549)/Protein of unknown function (DUF1553)
MLAAPQDPINFDTEIIPVLTKAGCNAGACHGAAAGRGGFRLSLFGADPGSDYESIVYALEGRRVNRAQAEKSLILLKPTGQLDHGGDIALDEGDPKTGRLLKWILAGAERGGPRKLASLEVTPRRWLCNEIPEKIPLKVIAHYDDGREEDVTRLTVFTSWDPSAVCVDENHQAHVTRRGQHTLIARFLNQVVPLQFNAPYSDKGVDLSAESREGFIDSQVLDLLSDLRLPVSPQASDAAWLRRVSLDLTGRLPEPEELEAFLADRSSEKRIRVVDELLASDAFADFWTLHFSQLLHIHSLPNEKQVFHAFVNWLKAEIAQGSPLNDMARQLLTATGDSHVVGPANFARMVPDARAHAELVGQVFLGMRLGCANCHNHPLDKWTQDDYHGLAAVFARIERGRQVQLSPRGGVTNLRTGEPAIPRIPGLGELPPDGDHRSAVVEWITGPEQLYFARATVNRLWRAMFGRGLVEPPDDLRETNPPTHPELLETLARDFVDNGYNIRHTLKQIAISYTYARSSSAVPGNELDDRFYAMAIRRPLAPEVLVDAISDVTGVREEFAGQENARAVAIVDPLTAAPALDILGRCNRAEGCGETASHERGVPAQLHLLNGELINQKVADKDGRLHRLIDSGRSDREIVVEFYIRGLGRHPDDTELQDWCERLAAEDPQERSARLEDFLWALLTSREFQENH